MSAAELVAEAKIRADAYMSASSFRGAEKLCAMEREKLHEVIERLGCAAASWDALMALCGHWQDGSQEPVTLSQDDATRTCHITVGTRHLTSTCPAIYADPRRAYGGSFEAALEQLK